MVGGHPELPREFKTSLGADKMALWVKKVLTTKPNDVTSIPGNHIMEERTESHKSSS